MMLFWSFCVIFLPIRNVFGLSVRKEDTILISGAYSQDDCDPSAIPVMANFDMKQFAGSWYELAKSASGYIDVNDGMWKIASSNSSSSFLFSGRDNNGHCIRPIKGKIHSESQPPGMIKLSYQTYSTHVEEYIRVLFTDYTSIAVVYLCMYHIHKEKEICHPAGIMGAIWTRKPHVDLNVYEEGLRYLEFACVHRSILVLRNQVGPCKLDDLGFQIDSFPVPDYCYQPKDLGHCRGNLQRYYYDPKAKTCESFSFSGCGGNRNNFMSLPECQDNCLSASTKEPICMSIAKCALHCSPCCTEDSNGCVECNCERVIIDPAVRCQKSPSDCPSNCVAKEYNPVCYVCNCHASATELTVATPACLEVPAAGDCNQELQRFYYHALTGKCEEFTYTGCKGNKNNFETLEKCAEACGGSDTVFKMGAVVPHENNGGSEVQPKSWLFSSFILLLAVFLADIS